MHMIACDCGSNQRDLTRAQGTMSMSSAEDNKDDKAVNLDLESQTDSSINALGDFSDQHFGQENDSKLTNVASLAASENSTTPASIRMLDAVLDNLHPMHFVITMGIGITSGVLYNFPIEKVRKGSRYVGIVYFFINLVAFFVIHALFLLKYCMICGRYKTSFRKILSDHTLNVFLGCEVMGFSTIINMIHFMKPDWWVFAYVLWWINVVLSLLAGWGITFVMFGINRIPQAEVNGTILLPVVTMTVVSSTGSLIAQSFTASHPGLQFASDIITYLLWANAVTLALLFVCFYFNRLMTQGLPPKPAVYTCFIPIGVLGQGGWAIQLNWKNVADLIVSYNGLSFFSDTLNVAPEYLGILGSLLHIFGICVALFLGSLGVCLTVISIMSVMFYGKPPIWVRSMWASTFPLGTMAVSFNQMYNTTGNIGFQVTGAIYSVALILITTYCIVCTLIYEIPYKEMREARKEKL